jgi:hypothetical protein
LLFFVFLFINAHCSPKVSEDAFREMEIIISRERWDPEEVQRRAEADAQERIKAYEERVRKEGEFTDADMAEAEEAIKKIDDDDDDDDDGDGEDDPFETFSIRVRETGPGQVVRFDRNAGSEPLWIAKAAQCPLSAVPPCENCGAARRFECQLMPQLINYLVPDGGSPGDVPIDWGVLAVYTCSASCDPPAGPSGTPGYLKEYVWRQAIPRDQSVA